MTYTCLRCGYTWIGRSECPSRCPHCKSTRWNKAMVIDRCQRCKAEWVQRGDETPKYCPVCHSAMWDAKKKTFTCPKCGNTRTLRSNSRSGRCPLCDNYNGNRLRHVREECPGISRMIHLWGDGNGLTLSYLDNGRGNVYLYDQGKILGETNLDSLCESHGCQFSIGKANEPSMKPIYLMAVDEIKKNQILSEKRIESVSTLHNIDDTASKVLIFHNSGMQPAIIALKLGVPFDYVMETISDSPRIQLGSDFKMEGPEPTIQNKDSYARKEKEST